jgi:hypothetical protein
MSAKQFQHFVKFHRRIAELHRLAKRNSKGTSSSGRVSANAVTAAKQWLAGANQAHSSIQ